MERDTTEAAHVEDSAEVRSGKFTFRVVAYDNQAAADGYLASLRGIVKTNPDQIAILRDLLRPEVVATGTIEEPAKVPIARFIRFADLAMDTDPAEVAKLETGTADAPVSEAPSKVKEPEADRGGGAITVPNVVGKNHQLAQDTMQAAGLYALVEKDCTGTGRLLLWDRNWVVVEQQPPPGTQAGPDVTITLCSKKYGE